MKNSNKKNFFVVLLIFVGIWCYSGCSIAEEPRKVSNKEEAVKQEDKNTNPGLNEPVKIGYFFGGRTHALYRAHINKYFEDEGIDVELHTQFLYEYIWHKVPKTHSETQELQDSRREPGASLSRLWGKVTGVRIIEAMEEGMFEAGTPGESSFLYCVANGSPIVAVALLGHEDKERPGKGIAVRTGVIINSPEDFRGKRFISRRAGPGDAVVLKEFLEDIGLDVEKDVTVIDQVKDDQQRILLKEKKVDAALLHMHGIPQAEREGIVYLYRGMDWINPEMSQALLVVRKDFLETHPQEVKKIIRAYMKRLKYEHELPEEEKHKKADFGIQIKEYYKGLSLPIFDYPPLIRLDLLEEMQRLLLKYKFIDKKVNLEEFVNNDFVKEIYEELK